MSKNLENGNNLTKLDAVLEDCLNLLGDAIRLTEALEPESKDRVFEQISAAAGNILYAQTFVPENARMDRDEEIPIPNEPLTEEQQERVSNLTVAEIQEIDDALIRNVSHQWRKMAMVIGLVMTKEPNLIHGIPDIYYAQRLRRLVENGLLESQGNTDYMRFSEVRLPKVANGDKH